MTTDAYTTECTNWHYSVAAYEAAHATFHACSKAPHPEGEAAEMARHDAMCDAWEAMIDTPAPDANAAAYKLRRLISEVYAEEIGDDVDDLAFLQHLLNDRTVDGPAPLVRLYQDALRQAGADHPAVSLDRIIDKPWTAFATDYRRAVAQLRAGLGAAEGDNAVSLLNDRHHPLYNALLAYPVKSAEELAEKIELVAIDCWDEDSAFKAVAADAVRIAGAAH